ncbi:nucleoside/nucleotide kinase family protein [Plantactinospora endophytica]|uniref:Uridine kinase n=1 Tax=Plantactinospora endophytica TaxID=673535 RepID=A0ABQ4DYA0_9ACTN|nr:uridine kinase [Plantactinospora endophytica]GIG87433.1 uridine kinase [Plantactinospora endophytica]
MRVRPITPELLVEELAGRLAGERGDGWLRVAVDGPPAAEPGRLADALVDPLRVRGRPAVRIDAADFLRPASLRYEQGRTNPDAYYLGWLDEAGLRREVLDPAGPDGSGRILPSLWNAETDRATRADYLVLPPHGVLLVSGPLLLGGALPFDLAVHLVLSPGALARRTPAAQRWTLPAFARYADEVGPASFADVVVRLDDPRHPALVEPETVG